MDGRGLTIEPLSFSRLATQNFRLIYAHKLQGYRWLLGLAASFHLTPVLGKLYWHYATHHTPSIFPDFLAFCLSVGARVTWLLLFRDPAEFLHFKRSGRGYRLAVCGTVILTTLPNGVVHVWALKMALQNDSLVASGRWPAVVAIVFLVPLAGLVSWMAWRFLLKLEENNEEFEPTIKTRSPFTTYADNPSSLPARTAATDGYLSKAYEEQKLRELEVSPAHSSAQHEATTVLAELQPDAGVNPEEPLIETNVDIVSNNTKPLRCQTIARFEHRSESHAGPHSWFSFPIFPAILSGYACVLLIGLPIWIHEDRKYKLRDPSPTLKKTLYMPLGMCLLAFYASKHRIRASLFEHFNTDPPQPWKKMLSILPSWFGTGGTFKNRDTGEITVWDPGRRAFPWQAHYNPSIIRSRQYMTAFNTNPGSCTSYWGHSGRSMKTEFRIRATLHRLGFLSLATFFVCKGYWHIIMYDLPGFNDVHNPSTITGEDLARILRILRFWQGFMFSSFFPAVFGFVYGVGCMASMLVLFTRTVWKHVPQEEKDQIMRDHREWERRNAVREAAPP